MVGNGGRYGWPWGTLRGGGGGGGEGGGRFGIKQAAGTPGHGLYPPHQRPRQSMGTNHIGQIWPQVGDLETTLDRAGLAGLAWLAWLGWLGWLGWLSWLVIL